MIRKKIWNTQDGFSLVELITVIGLVAALAAVAVPTFLNGLPTYRLRAAARDLTANLQKTRMGAVKEGKDWALVFNSGSDSYEIRSDYGGAGENVEITVSLSGYGSGVAYGHGNASDNFPGSGWGVDTDNTFPDIDATTYVAEYGRSGFLLGVNNTRYVYLANQNGDSFAIGAQRSGVIRMIKWGESAWQ